MTDYDINNAFLLTIHHIASLEVDNFHYNPRKTFVSKRLNADNPPSKDQMILISLLSMTSYA